MTTASSFIVSIMTLVLYFVLKIKQQNDVSQMVTLYVSIIKPVATIKPQAVNWPPSNTNSMPLFTTSSSAAVCTFVKAGIIPDVIQEIDPKVLILAKYGVKDVELGEAIPVNHSQERPKILLIPQDSALNPTDKYTVVLADPDAPSRENPKWRSYAHWAHCGLSLSGPGNLDQGSYNTGGTSLSEGKEILEYMGPAPPPGTGFHRYCFLVFKEIGKPLTGIPSDRKSWNVTEWARENGLTCLGASWFVAKNDKQ